jgi:LPS O-antigen subunit length determinant protein (WzzB/FepE family)
MNAPKISPVQIDPVQIEPDKRFKETPQDEISLLDLLDIAVRIVDFAIRKRSIILSITIISTLLAAGYAQSIVPKYKATIGFLMPQEISPPKAIATKNTTEFQNIIKETKISLYQNFLMKIQSYNFQREVFDRGNFLEKFVDNPNGSAKSDAVVLEINKSISLTGVPVKKAKKAKNTELFNKPIFLEMEGSKPEAMAEFFNALVKTGIKTIPIEDHLLNTIDQRLKTISAKKTYLQSQENKTQENKKYAKEIDLLTKDLAMARRMNIEKNNFRSAQPLNGAPRWYLYGAKILEEELKVLQSKAKNNDAIEKAKLSISQKTLDMELMTWGSFKALKSPDVVIIDQPSIPPTQPIQNKKASIIFTGLIVGLLFGSAFAFFQHARGNLNAKRNLGSEVNKKTRSFVFKHSS